MNRTKACSSCGGTRDIVRGVDAFPHTYDINQFGQAFGTTPAAQWSRGELVRDVQPALSLRPPIPMYDPTIVAHSEIYRRPH